MKPRNKTTLGEKIENQLYNTPLGETMEKRFTHPERDD
jgi:hypothetical protein